MKVNVCLLLTIVSAYCLIDGCEGTRWGHWRPPVRGYLPIRRWSPIRTWHPRPTTTIYRGRKSAEFMYDNQDDVNNVDLEDRHLDELYVDMNNEDVMDDIDERYVDDPQEDD